MSEQSWVIVAGAAVTIGSLWVKSYYDRKQVQATTTDKVDEAVLAAKASAEGIEHMRVMLDGQRTAMLEELKTARNEIVELKKLVSSQRETAAAVAATTPGGGLNAE